MRSTRQRRWLMAAAMAILPVVAPHAARAQSALGNGHALDANNRVGSGGINDAVNNGSLVTPNDIIYGNVTGGRGFQGRLNETDPLAFRGTLPGGTVDQFIAGSSGVPSAYAPAFSLSQPRPFYGADQRGVAPPAGSVLLGSTGAAIGTDLSPANPYSSVPGLDALAAQRPGSTNIVGVSGVNPNMLVVPGTPGSSDPTMQSALLGNPVYGATFNPLLQNSDLILNSNLAIGPASPTQDTLSDKALEQIRQQLQGTNATVQPAPTDQGLNPDNSTNPDSTSNGGPGGVSPLNPLGRPQVPGSLNAGPLQMPLDSPLNSQLSSGRLGQPLQSGALGTYTEGNKALPLASPAAYSPAYQQMQLLLKRYNVQQAKPFVPRKTSPGGPTTRPGGDTGVNPPAAIPPGSAEAVKITSLASGIEVKGLHDVLAAGDDALKQGKYKSAIDQYTTAMRVAPNNRLFMLGRANAELGAGYYGQAEMDIRRAVFDDPTVLMARFDLSSMMSADRLDFIQKDLQSLTKDPKASRPWFLLAYLAYNAGDTNTAATDLQEAQKRSGSADTVIPLMEKYWSLPASAPAEPKPELNK